MSSAQVAVIDFGTNTFHLLIVEKRVDGGLKTIHKERIYVKLGQGGIAHINKASYERGLNAIAHFTNLLKHYEGIPIRAVGTAALRNARNAEDFIRDVKNQTGVDIEIISGSDEAEYIFRGVSLNMNFEAEHALIMDIGGGSVEFILTHNQNVLWTESFQIGVSILHAHFHKSEPILPAEVEAINVFLDTQLEPLTSQLEKHKVSLLIGASGTFDVIRNNCAVGNRNADLCRIDLHKLDSFQSTVIKADLHRRKNMPGIPESRADMIVVALILVEHVRGMLGPHDLMVSRNAMKEGVARTMLEI